MSNVTVCARFRPLSSKEKREDGDRTCIRGIDDETFVLTDDKEDLTLSFDKVFYQGSEQLAVYEFIALPIIRDAVNGINGSIITYGQTGAGKTYSMEGPGIVERDEQKKGLIQRVVEGLFECLKSLGETTKCTIKLSMVEIYMEKVRDLFDLSKENIQITEHRSNGILLSGVTEMSVFNPGEALQSLSNGIANRAVGETQMNMASSRSHCIYMFTVRQELIVDNKVKTGKLVLVDLAGSEKLEKTGAEGRALEEAKTINKSLSALGNVVNALTCSPLAKGNHIPYRDSKLTRILQDSLGGKSRTALLCCCSPSPSNAAESLSTLRFGSRAKRIKAVARFNYSEDKNTKKPKAPSPTMNDSCERILNKMREKMDVEDVKLLEELFIQEGIFFDPESVEEVEAAYEDITLHTIRSLHQAVDDLSTTITELEAKLAAAERLNKENRIGGETNNRWFKISGILRSFSTWFLPFSEIK